MTNNQAGRLSKYKAQEKGILAYLTLFMAIRNYRIGYHSGTRSAFTYYNLKINLERLKTVEDILVKRGLSRQKLQRMKTLVRRYSIVGELDLRELDVISDYGVMLFLRSTKLENCQIRQFKQLDQSFYQEYNNIICKKRQAALKSKRISDDARVRNGIRRMKRLYLELKPNNQNVYEFINGVLDKLETDDNYLEGLVVKARKRNPLYVY